MRVKWDEESSAYDAVIDIIKDWCEENDEFDDFIVTLRIGNNPIWGAETVSEILICHLENYDFDWVSDWWEGEYEVELLGFVPINRIITEGNTIRNRKPREH